MQATKTLAAINAKLEADQDKEHRLHLGASVLGHECGRAVWYGFRWAAMEEFAGKQLRLFDRGNEFEPRAVEWLRLAGMEVWDIDERTGKQFRISDHDGYFGGSLDGVGRGCPDLPPGTPFLTEFKTHNDASFKAYIKDGLCKSKPAHFVQCQVYMFKMGLPWALYVGVNKNTDDMEPELIQANPYEGQRLIDRAGAIIFSLQPPPKVHQKKNYYLCNWCKFKDICHEKAMPEKNCRTCEHVRMTGGGQWACGLSNTPLSKYMQHKGCREWVLMMDFHK